MAIPGILKQLASTNPMMGKIKQMMGMLNTAQNPQAMMNQLMANNPNMKQAIDLIKQSGGDPQKAFCALAEQKGVDPQEILNMLQG